MSPRLRIVFGLLATLSVALCWHSLSESSKPWALGLPPLQDNFANQSTLEGERAKEVQAALQYMVWPRERKRLLKEYQGLLRETLPRQPFSADAWARLLAVEYELGETGLEQQWSLAHLLELREWLKIGQNPLIFYCVRLAAEMQTTLYQQCDDFLRHAVWRADKAWQARVIGLEEQELLERLQRAGID